MAYQQGIMCLEVGGPVCTMTRTMGTSTRCNASNTVQRATCWAQESSLTRDLFMSEVWIHGGICGGEAPLKKKKKLWSTREQISSRSETLHSTHHPPPRVYSTVSPMWRSRGNGFDLLHPEPLSLGVKQKIGQWDRMFLDNFSCERGSTPLCLRLSAGLCGKCGRSASLSWLQDLKRMNRGSQRGQHSFEMYG